MLEIDYSLVPMSEADHQFVLSEVQRRVRTGQIPPPDRSVNGRLVLLNPDLVQTLHQIPDELRPRLRRVVVPTHSGSTHYSAERLYQQIIESDERLYVLVIELQSEFRAFSAFLDYLPQLRARYPELAVYLSGTPEDLRKCLQQVLAEGGATLVLQYGADRRVELADTDAFQRAITTEQQVLSYTVPFFTEIRLRLVKGARPLPFDLTALRRLHPVFGFGPIEDVDVGGGKRERRIIVDLPVALVHDFRFRQDRSLDFLGVVIDGKTVLSGYFGDEKLEFHWIPMGRIQQFLRRGTGGKQERIEMQRVRTLRVNTLTGEVSFLMHDAGEQVAVEQADRLSFRKAPRAPRGAEPLSASAAEVAEQLGEQKKPGANGSGAEAAPELTIEIDRYLRPSPHSAQQDPVQDAVRMHFYRKLVGEQVEHSRKRELYAQRMRAGAVGPLAGQTLKLLRRFGLERLIDPRSFYYLCDTPEEVPRYRQTGERYEQHFGRLVELIRDVASVQPTDRARLADIAYCLPISTEWIDTGLATLSSVKPPELDAVYHEMRLLADFIAHEFRRNFDPAGEDVAFFTKLRTCREVSLLAKWLADFKRGAYGQPLPETAYPDVVFYSTAEDKQTSDQRYCFPSMACSELVTSPAARSLFDGFDYDFSVFLEEQMALAVHYARAEGVLEPGPAEFNAYFSRKTRETQDEQHELEAMREAIDDAHSPLYQRMLEQEERAYRERYRQFQEDRERVANELQSAERRAESLVNDLLEQLQHDAADAALLDHLPEAPDALEKRILEIATRVSDRHVLALNSAFGELTEHIDTWCGHLQQLVESARRCLHEQEAWRAAEDKRQAAALHAYWLSRHDARLDQLRRMRAPEREEHLRRVETQRRNYLGELQRMQAQLRQQTEQNRRATDGLHRFVRSASKRLTDLRGVQLNEAPEKVVAQAESLRTRLTRVSRDAGLLAERVQALQTTVDRMHVRMQRHRQRLYGLRVEQALVKAVETRTDPVLPDSGAPGSAPPAAEAPERAEGERLHGAWEAQAASMRRAERTLGGSGSAVEGSLQAVRGQALAYRRFGQRHGELVKALARKSRLHASAAGLAERQAVMNSELEDLPRRVQELFMPARKKLLMQQFLPEVEQRLVQLDKAQHFVSELLNLSEEPLRARYLDHAIFRRFYRRQFMRGGAFAADPKSPLHHSTRNVGPALRLLHKGLVHNFQRAGLPGLERVQMPLLTHKGPQEILATLENLASLNGRSQFDYIVLPPTLDLKTGLTLLERKDALYGGVPRLVLIFVTRFDPQILRRDPELRDAYFRAVKHNVVLNIDGHVVVDNPRSIGMRLLQETLGSASDMAEVEEPDEAANVD